MEWYERRQKENFRMALGTAALAAMGLGLIGNELHKTQVREAAIDANPRIRRHVTECRAELGGPRGLAEGVEFIYYGEPRANLPEYFNTCVAHGAFSLENELPATAESVRTTEQGTRIVVPYNSRLK